MLKHVAFGVALCAQFMYGQAMHLTLAEGSLETADGARLTASAPLFSLIIGGETYFSDDVAATERDGKTVLDFGALSASIEIDETFDRGAKATVVLTNETDSIIVVENVVPFGAVEKRVHITSTGPWALNRAKLFRPDKTPVSLTLPDNAWEMGYGAAELEDGRSVCAIARRVAVEEADKKRYETRLKPGGSATYDFYADAYEGEWQNGLVLMFQDRYLYDLVEFDDSLYQREDQQWIRRVYLMYIEQSWDHDFLERFTGELGFFDLLDEGDRLFGGYDAYHLWPTWPNLGIDPRNQFDHHEALPDGIPALREMFDKAKERGVKLFVTYNPWDRSTREVDHFQGLAEMLVDLNADGVILDTYWKSSDELQHMADSIRPGIVMYSEGMASPEHLPGIVSGRVHDAFRYQSVLNLNKLIKPDFAFFRVLQLVNGRYHREAAISLFNGYGNEINVMIPGRPPWREEESIYLGKITKTLREHSTNFTSMDWTPLVATRLDDVWVNRFPTEAKTVYTVFSLTPEGVNAPLFEAEPREGRHFHDVWNHQEVEIAEIDGATYATVEVRGFDEAWLDTRREGNVSVIVDFPEALDVRRDEDTLFVNADRGDSIVVTPGAPTYQNKGKAYPVEPLALKLLDEFGRYEGDYVVQLFADGELIDQRVESIPYATARLVSEVSHTERAEDAPDGMIEIPEGEFQFITEKNEGIIPYPDFSDSATISMPRFFVDKHPVTNAQYKEFLDATNYRPDDDENFLKHWNGEDYPDELANHPVVYVSIEDAKAYAAWAGKRLPTQTEWQYAAQGTDGRAYPWGDELDSTKCNNASGATTPVDAFPEGENQFGVADLVGNVWQMTNDVYDDVTYYFQILKGGSFFKPTSSWWYVEGGPHNVRRQQMLLMVSPGYDRQATVGFRCVKDAK